MRLVQMQNLPIAGYLTKPLTRDKIIQLLPAHFGHSTPASYFGSNCHFLSGQHERAM